MAWHLTPEAEQDVNAVYIQSALQFGLAQADRCMTDLRATLALIAAMPRRTRERPEIRGGIRLYRFRAHHVFYTINDGDVVIVRILGGQQDWEDLL